MSSPNTGSGIPKDVLFINNINFCINAEATAMLTIAEITNANDLLSNLGIFLFSFSKNGFNPFFIPRFVKYMTMYNIIKLIATIEYL